ncbi:MAG TPA: PfkB family carbohydrate kinase [Syntrophorhabdaceae bacterium]|nr:PfkB family carbohydrate kinase [Syntrophorhabdaceae bacterium]
MINLLVIGTIAYDSIETPFGKVENALGGSALHFTNAASFFADVGIVATVGKDFDLSSIDFLEERNVDLRGISIEDGKTFRWEGRYGYDLNQAITLKTELNVIDKFKPRIPDDYVKADFVFLANIDPELQLYVIEQINKKATIVLDTMNFWIENKFAALIDAIKKVNILVVNESELREITKEYSLIRGAKKIMELGPSFVIVKRGEYGVFMAEKEGIFLTPAYPLEEVFDPTGAGDTFAGGFMGYLANVGEVNSDTIKKATVMGSVMASFNVEDFGINRIKGLKYDEIRGRYTAFKRCLHFEDIEFK